MVLTDVYELVNMHNWLAVILPASLDELAYRLRREFSGWRVLELLREGCMEKASRIDERRFHGCIRGVRTVVSRDADAGHLWLEMTVVGSLVFHISAATIRTVTRLEHDNRMTAIVQYKRNNINRTI